MSIDTKEVPVALRPAASKMTLTECAYSVFAIIAATYFTSALTEAPFLASVPFIQLVLVLQLLILVPAFFISRGYYVVENNKVRFGFLSLLFFVFLLFGAASSQNSTHILKTFIQCPRMTIITLAFPQFVYFMLSFVIPAIQKYRGNAKLVAYFHVSHYLLMMVFVLYFFQYSFSQDGQTYIVPISKLETLSYCLIYRLYLLQKCWIRGYPTEIPRQIVWIALLFVCTVAVKSASALVVGSVCAVTALGIYTYDQYLKNSQTAHE